MMVRLLALGLCVLLSPAGMALAGETERDGPVPAPRSAGGEEQAAAAGANGKPEAREMSGMSIVGNDEAPKSLYIVPWKSSDVGTQTSLDPMLTEEDVPVDREVFRRRIEFYRISTGL